MSRMDPNKWMELIFESVQEVEVTSEEIIAVRGKVQDREVVAYAHNPKKNQGFISSQGARDILAVMKLAQEQRAPIVALMASPGVSVEEGIKSGEAYTKVIAKNIELSGYIPQIAMIMGTTMGAPAYSATLMDFVLCNKSRSTLMVTGPAVIEKVLGQKTTIIELGGAQIHAQRTGIADSVSRNIDEQIKTLKNLLSFLPSHCEAEPLRQDPTPPGYSIELPKSPREAYDIHKFIRGVIDADKWFEIKADFAKSVVTALARINGEVIAIVANQSKFLAGALDYQSARKAARFIRLMDSFNIPLLNLIDVPGFMPGEQQEHNGLLRYGAQMCQSMRTTTPRWSLVVRRCYGAAAFLMMQTRSQGGEYVMALPDASVAIMGYAGAKTMIYPQDGVDRSEEYYQQYENPQIAKRLGIVDEILEAKEVRSRLIQLREKSRNKIYRERILKKHLTLP